MRVTRDDPDGCVGYESPYVAIGSPCKALEERVGSSVEYGGMESASKETVKSPTVKSPTVKSSTVMSSNVKSSTKKKSGKPSKVDKVDMLDRFPDGDESDVVNEKYPHLKLDLKNTKYTKTSKPCMSEIYDGECRVIDLIEPSSDETIFQTNKTPFMSRKKITTIQKQYGRDNYSYVKNSSEENILESDLEYEEVGEDSITRMHRLPSIKIMPASKQNTIDEGSLESIDGRGDEKIASQKRSGREKKHHKDDGMKGSTNKVRDTELESDLMAIDFSANVKSKDKARRKHHKSCGEESKETDKLLEDFVESPRLLHEDKTRKQIKHNIQTTIHPNSKAITNTVIKSTPEQFQPTERASRNRRGSVQIQPLESQPDNKLVSKDARDAKVKSSRRKATLIIEEDANFDEEVLDNDIEVFQQEAFAT